MLLFDVIKGGTAKRMPTNERAKKQRIEIETEAREKKGSQKNRRNNKKPKNVKKTFPPP